MKKQSVLTLILLSQLFMGTAFTAQDDGEGWITLLKTRADCEKYWQISEENPSTFSIEKYDEDEDMFKMNGPRAHLFYMGDPTLKGPFKKGDFQSFEFKAEVKTLANSNGGIFFHTQYQKSGWPGQGYEAQVNQSFGRDHRKTGSLYRIQDVRVGLHDDNAWYTEHIIVKGHRVVIKINGRAVVDCTLPKLTRGTFALQGHDPGSTVYYRNIRIKPLPDDVPSYTAPKGWKKLFDGRTLKGFKQINGTARYEVVDGAIKGTTVAGSPNSFLCTKPYQDFELKFKVKVDPRLNSGVQVRSNSLPEYRNGRVHGYQVEIANNKAAGFVYDEARRAWLSQNRDNLGAFKADDWNEYRVACVGNTIRTWVNEIPCTDLTDDMTLRGFIGFQVHSFKGDPAWVMWKDIEIKVLRPTKRKRIKAAVVTGGHAFQQEPFYKVFDNIRFLDYVKTEQKDDSELFEDISNWDYDVIVFYNMSKNINEKRQANFVKLLEKGVGVVALHHVLGAYPEWPEFSKIIGGKYIFKKMDIDGQTLEPATYKHDVDMDITITGNKHMITRGLKDFTIHDESYKGVWHDKDNYLLLTCDHPTSDSQVGWTRTYKNSRIATIQLGHDGKSFENPNFNILVNRAIRWASQQ